MRVENQTSDPVEYEQNGGGGRPENACDECPQVGSLAPGAAKELPCLCGTPPYEVSFKTQMKEPAVQVTVTGIRDPKAVVVLAGLPVIIPG